MILFGQSASPFTSINTLVSEWQCFSTKGNYFNHAFSTALSSRPSTTYYVTFKIVIIFRVPIKAFESVDAPFKVEHSNDKWHHLPVVLNIMLFQVILTFETVEELLSMNSNGDIKHYVISRAETFCFFLFKTCQVFFRKISQVYVDSALKVRMLSLFVNLTRLILFLLCSAESRSQQYSWCKGARLLYCSQNQTTSKEIWQDGFTVLTESQENFGQPWAGFGSANWMP